MFGFGIVMALLGAVLPELAHRLHFDLAQAGTLFLSMNAAMLITSFSLGPLIDRFGHKPPLTLAPLFVAGALVLISTASAFRDLVVALALAGIGGGALNQVTNTLVADLYSDAREKSAKLNLLGVFFGFGAVSVPFLIGSLLSYMKLPHILLIAALISLLPTALGTPLTFPPPHQREGISLAEVLQFLKQPLVLIFGVLLFFESGNEFIIGGYLAIYLSRHLGQTAVSASYLLALYWAAVMAGRLVLSRASVSRIGGTLISLGAAAVASAMVLLLIAHSMLLATFAVVLLGLSIAPIFPIALGIMGSIYPNHTGTIFGILMGIALAGGIILPLVVGNASNHWGLEKGLFVTVFDAIAILGLQFCAQRRLGPHAREV